MENTEKTLEKALVETIEQAKGVGAKVVEELYVQVPDLVEQLLNWHFARSIVENIVALVMIVGVPCLTTFIIKKLYKKIIGSCGQDFDSFSFWFPTSLISAFIVIPMLVHGMCRFNLNWLYIWLAPKIYMLEYVVNLSK